MKILPPVRNDSQGLGHFGAPRGNRTHNGIDFAAYAGSKVLSHIEGFITKYGYPYGDDLAYRYVNISDAAGRNHRFFYVQTELPVGTLVEIGDVIGTVQNIANRYPEMIQHVHYEVKHNGEYLDPEGFLYG